ncbi:hypothetical protein QWY93_13980 [Echinicola jeungdonensis]|nr:sigma factor-like helix-turn-helix DNA-binding protein [Echinicola jeungdonensis]MDN3670426.1 hypothetical protein [Echinicola jeungdonensis]
MLHYFEGLSYKEIADMMGFGHVRSARNLLYKAVNGLSSILKKYHGDLFVLIGLLFYSF